MTFDSSVPSIIDRLLTTSNPAERNTDSKRDSNEKPQTKRKQRKQHRAQLLELPRDRLAITLQRCRSLSGISLAKLAVASGVDVAHIWRIEQGEHQNVSREILLLLSMGMILDPDTLDQVVAVANEILDAAGLKMLRAPWERKSQPGHKNNPSKPEQNDFPPGK
jgi:transcriptional regulator with XRE-family HTH domain